MVPLRGNVDTRIAKLDAGEYDAIILACAGLERLGLGERISSELCPPEWLPAATQGIIGLQCREGDERTLGFIRPLEDEDAAVQALAERTVAGLLQGSCQVPLAAHAALQGDEMTLEALVGTPDGQTMIRSLERGPRAQAAGLG